MESASLPELELLPEPGTGRARAAAHATPPAAAAGSDAARAASASDPAQTSLNFVAPELYLAADSIQAASGEAGSGDAAKPVPAQDALPEVPRDLMLEDPVVDELLSAAPGAAAPAFDAASAAGAATGAAVAAGASAAAPSATSAANPSAATVPFAGIVSARSTRVPLARTAAMAARAVKASAASNPPTKPTAAQAAIPTVRPAPAAAQSLASWASARSQSASAAADAAKATAVATPPTATPSPAAKPLTAVPSTKAPPGASSPAAPPKAPAADRPPAGASPVMDQDFIARNQVVERYLSGRLPLKGATDFERFCHEHPELLDAIGLPERVNAGVRLLEASGKPEPWDEPPRPAWQKPQVTLALGGASAILALALAILAQHNAVKTGRIARLQRQVFEQALDPATSTREIRLLPSRLGASDSPAIVIGGGQGAQLADFRIDESRSPYRSFRVTIDRIDQGRVGIINNLTKDSNGHLRIALNSSALGPGNYQLTLEGLDWRGDPQPDSWVTIGITR